MHTAPTFLQTVAAHVLAHHAPREVTVVLPSQRAATRFLAEYARLRGGRPGWLPATTTLNGLLQQATGLTPVGSMEALAQLFLAHKAVPKDGDAGGFAAFLQWGRLALQDFNELDQYRCDVDSVLTNLTRIKELDHWHIDDPGELSEAQQRYLQQYERLNPIYHRFQEQLLANGGGTGGSIARAAAERGRIDGWGHVVLAGMGALTPAEMGYLERLHEAGRLTVFADADAAYVQPDWEAGEFIAEQRARLPVQPLSNRLSEAQPALTFVGCSTRVFECQYVRDLLHRLVGAGDSLDDTVVVLPDGRTLSMLMQSLDLGEQRVNVTMGLSWTESPVAGYFELIWRMVLRPGTGWRHDEVRALLSHPVSKALGGEGLPRDASRVLGELARRHWVWVGDGEVEALEEGPVKRLLGRLRALRVEEPGAFLAALQAWCAEVQGELDALGDAHDPWLRASWRPVGEAVGVCARFHAEHGVFEGRREVRDLAFQVLNQERVDLRGEPDQGLQIMGIIETRAIDFKRVVVLDCNEGTLPKSSHADSFIPYDLRSALKLPTRHRREAIYAYYLYRLLNRAEEVVLVHLKDDPESEPSRYLKQLAQAFQPGGKPLEIAVEAIEAQLPERRPEIQAIRWTEFAAGRARAWAEGGMSPSALNTLLQCPRNFYYQYLMRLREPDEVQEVLSSAQFGNVVHNVFEWGLEAARDREVTVDDLVGIWKQVEPLLDRALAQHYNPKLMAIGENRIALTLARNTIKALIDQEVRELKSGKKRTLRGLEIALSTRVESSAGPFTLTGKADRVDVEGPHPVLIDYKSGKVEANELKLGEDWAEMLAQGKRPKALQLLVYSAIALRGLDVQGKRLPPGEAPDPHHPGVRSGIRSGRRASHGLLELNWQGATAIPHALANTFLEWTAGQLEALYCGEIAALHQADSRYCPYCVVLDPPADYF